MAPPPYGGSAALSFPPAEQRPRWELPVDEHLVTPEVTRDEIIRGRKVIAQPALEPHAEAHTDLAFVVRAHVRPGYIAAVDLLTRVTESSDFATDACIRKAGHDPSTGRRWLEELAFEIATTQKNRNLREKAEDLRTRGVRRVFAIFPIKGAVGEWSSTTGDFVLLPADAMISDPTLVRPMSVRALLEAAEAGNEVVRGLEAQGNPEIARVRLEGVERGIEQGQREMLGEMLVERFGKIPERFQTRLSAAKTEALRAWMKKAFAGSSLEEIFAEEGG